jgi:hypothetical protein
MVTLPSSGLLCATGVAWRGLGLGLMLVELSVVEQRYHAVMEVVCGGVPVAEVAERYGVSRKTVHAWLGRYRQEGLPGLADRVASPASPSRAAGWRGRGSGVRATPDPSPLGSPPAGA